MIQAVKLTKKFDKFTALKEVSCEIPEGSIYGLVGSNGAGKSTFLRVLTGIYQPDGGQLLVDGEPVFENPAQKAKIAFVPDDWYFLHGANLSRMIKLYQYTHPGFDVRYCEELSDYFRLDRKKPLSTFSKGMRRQAAILLALACRPRYLILDETYDGLDPIMRGMVRSVLCQEAADRKMTAVLTSHSLRELEDTCDQLALLHEGGLVLQSDLTNLRTRLFKVQIAFSHEFGRSDFGEMTILHYEKSGSVANMIVQGDREAVMARLKEMDPLLLDLLPLTLEEVFTYELAALGYQFDPELFFGDAGSDGAEESGTADRADRISKGNETGKTGGTGKIRQTGQENKMKGGM